MTNPFAELGLSKPVLHAVEKMGFTEPTPVQEQAIPCVLEGRDICAAAATGTGKTAAFLLPTLSTLAHRGRGEGPRMLVVSPTRELAEQIGKACYPIARKTKHFTLTVTGGTSYGPQIRELRRGVDVLIATPGRLNDLRDRGVVDLSQLEVLVIDEADRMCDMGFWPDMESIISATPKERQTLLFSATFDPKVMRKVEPILNDPVRIEISRHGETASTVDQRIIPVKNKDKQELQRKLLSEKGSQRVIVFTRTKKRAEECMEQLQEAGFTAESIHSDKNQTQRRRALRRFADGKTDVLTATDVLARGIDVPSVNYVVNYDLPDMTEDYVHRIGRTGRAGENGFAVSFVTRESRSLLADIQKLIDRELPVMELEGYEPDMSLLGSKRKKKGEGGGRGAKGGHGKHGAKGGNGKHGGHGARGGSRKGERGTQESRKGAHRSSKGGSRHGAQYHDDFQSKHGQSEDRRFGAGKKSEAKGNGKHDGKKSGKSQNKPRPGQYSSALSRAQKHADSGKSYGKSHGKSHGKASHSHGRKNEQRTARRDRRHHQ